MRDLTRLQGQPRVGKLHMSDTGKEVMGTTYDPPRDSTHYTTTSPNSSPSKALYH